MELNYRNTLHRFIEHLYLYLTINEHGFTGRTEQIYKVAYTQRMKLNQSHINNIMKFLNTLPQKLAVK